MIAHLESFGPQLGADVNAYTSYDETVYELSLPSTPELLDLGIEVLREWATEATLTSDDVIAERGVVIEEWRSGQGVDGRIGQLWEEALLGGTPYEGRDPIGELAALQTMTPELLRRFYEDWYRPERMAVIAVGDFDVDDMQTRIIEQFDNLEPSQDPLEPMTPQPAPQGSFRAFSLTDPEIPNGKLVVAWSTPATPPVTVGDLQQQIALRAAMGIVATRLNSDALLGVAPLLGAKIDAFEYSRSTSVVVLEAESNPNQIGDGIDAVATELAPRQDIRIHRTGSRPGDRPPRGDRRTGLRRPGTTPHWDTPRPSSATICRAAPLMDAGQRYAVEKGIIKRLTQLELHDALLRLLSTTPPAIVVTGPNNATPPLLEPTEIVQRFETASTTAVTPRQDPATIDSLMAAPEPGPVTRTDFNPDLGYTTIVYENGATVLLWPTTNSENYVSLDIASFGGTSLLPISDLDEAELISEIVTRSGLGPADAATRQTFIADHLVDVTPYLSETREGFLGETTTNSIEVMLQLIHLTMTQPRADTAASSSDPE